MVGDRDLVSASGKRARGIGKQGEDDQDDHELGKLSSSLPTVTRIDGVAK